MYIYTYLPIYIVPLQEVLLFNFVCCNPLFLPVLQNISFKIFTFTTDLLIDSNISGDTYLELCYKYMEPP